MPIRLPRKLDRLLHDAISGVSNCCAPEIKFTDNSLKINCERLLNPASETKWANSFEDNYYSNQTLRVSSHAATRLLELRNIYVTGSEAFIFSDSHTVLRLCASLDKHPTRKIRRPVSPLALRIDEPVFLLGGRAPGNRGHFLVEHLPRILLAHQRMGKEFPRKVMVTPGHGEWQREYLYAFGFTGIEVIEASPGTTWCRQAWTVPNLSRTGIAELCPPQLYIEMVKRLGLPAAKTTSQRNAIFITRKDAPGRRLANEDEIFSIAQRFLPEIRRVSLSGLSVEKQVNLFNEAKVVIGPHSQAFRGSLYARDALIIQLVPGHRTHDNEYRFWADNYSLIGTLHNNKPVSLYSEDSHAGAADNEYPTKRFTVELPELLVGATTHALS